jgi:hypothetical protein
MGLILPGIALIGIFAGFTVFATAALMVTQLRAVGSDERKRRTIVARSVVAIGLATTIWGLATVFCLWGVVAGFPWGLLFSHQRH